MPRGTSDRKNRHPGERGVGQVLKWIITRALRPLFPLSVRKRMVLLVGRRRLLFHHTFTMAMLTDFADSCPVEFHRFLWSHYLAYADTYEISRCFGQSQLARYHQALFADTVAYLLSRSVDHKTGVDSVFEVGCSLGYLLRFAETDVFPSAGTLRGLDIDRYAVTTGAAYLRSLGSRVELVAADITELREVMGEHVYDVVLCCGVLSYLSETTAAKIVEDMLRHTERVLAMACLAHPRVDNIELSRSDRRAIDNSFIHNLDRMVSEAGGTVARRRWESPKAIRDAGVYVVLAEPPGR